jgi:acyl carrier protein
MLSLVIDTIHALSLRGELPHDLARRVLAADTTIDELAIDSLGKLGLLSELEERADVGLSEGMLVGLRTVGDLAGMLERARQVAA